MPSLLLEAFSVVLAVLLALAVDEWREERADSALGKLAEERITTEIRANLEELSASAARHDEILAGLDRSLAEVPAEGSQLELAVNFSIAVLSSSAWETSRATQAVNHMDFDRVLRIARVYDLQDLYLEAQREVVRHISALGSGGGLSPQEILRGLRGRISTVQELEQGLLSAYREALAAETG
ncbi:MAG: hypothetical protein KDD47_28385 [Acidobacteria bacterium]|nr:hypothetical protein [Acidobacteriota bacterium]